MLIRSCKDEAMLTVSKDQATLNFLRETKELTSGKKVGITEMTFESRRFTYELAVITSHLLVTEAARLQKGKTPTSSTNNKGRLWVTEALQPQDFCGRITLAIRAPEDRAPPGRCKAAPKYGICCKPHNTMPRGTLEMMVHLEFRRLVFTERRHRSFGDQPFWNKEMPTNIKRLASDNRGIS